MTLATARITLRQICRLNMPGPVVLPALLPALRQVIRADHAAFFYCDERGNISNLYAERMLPPAEQAQFHDRHSEAQFRRKYLQRVHAPQPISRDSVTPQQRQQPYYTEVLARLGVEHMLYAIVRSNGRVLGQLSLYRGAQAPAFTGRDEDLLSEVLHYLGDALALPAPQADAHVQGQTVEEGMAVFDAQGQLLYADESWGRLIRMAKGDPITPATALYESQSVPRFVQQLLQTIDASPAALHRCDTAWGKFAFRRHPLQGPDGTSARGLIVARLAAEPLRLSQGAASLGLSPQQREVAMLLAQGKTNQAIAQALGVSHNTASYHVKQVFARLGVHDRAEVGKALIGEKP